MERGVAAITLVTMGAWGDLFPFVGLGRALGARGHEVRLAPHRRGRTSLPERACSLWALAGGWASRSFAAIRRSFSGCLSVCATR
jgi:hypothetical protein